MLGWCCVFTQRWLGPKGKWWHHGRFYIWTGHGPPMMMMMMMGEHLRLPIRMKEDENWRTEYMWRHQRAGLSGSGHVVVWCAVFGHLELQTAITQTQRLGLICIDLIYLSTLVWQPPAVTFWQQGSNQWENSFLKHAQNALTWVIPSPGYLT